MPFHSTGPHYCLVCPAEYAGKDHDRRYGVRLVLTESNCSGTGADLADCPRCGRIFQITYRVDKITELKHPRET